MTIGSAPQCLQCKHFDDKANKSGFYCKAFPEGIPEEILDGRHDHRKQFKGDRGILFEPKYR